MAEHETRTVDVDVTDIDTRGKTVHGFAAVYGAEARIGDITETIAQGAFAGVLDHDVRALLNHDPNVVLGRTKSGTLRLFDDVKGLRFEVDLPESRGDLREAIGRGDLDGASFRFVVGDESWDGDRRTITRVGELHDICLATYPAYPATSIELRTQSNNDAAEERQEDNMETEDRQEATPEAATGGLQVEDRITVKEARTLSQAFREQGFPAETATVEWGEFRAATYSGSLDGLSPVHTVGVDLGADQRYAWPVFPQVAVGAGDTSVQVLRQSARTLPSAASIVRAIDAVTAKPEVASELAVVTTALKQVAAIETNVPNVFLEQAAFNSVIETDLRLSLNEGLDKLVLDAVAASGFQAPGTDPLLVSIRKAMTTIMGSGYNPDTLVLTPANAEAIDTLRATATAGEQYYVFAPAQLAPRNIYGLAVRISKTAAAPFVADSAALGKMYVSPIALARFEVDAGSTNRSNVRLEGSAVFGTERQAAAVRIAAA